MLFTERTVAPTKNNYNDTKFYFESELNPYNPYYGIPNCTTYTLGRIQEIASENNITINIDGFCGNGGTWGNDGVIGCTWEKSSIPKLGAVAVWEEVGDDGHVAIIEKINPDGTIKTSNSGWDGAENVGNEESKKWWWVTDNLDYNNYLNYKFKYFLYPPYIDIPDTSTNKKRKNFPWFITNRKRVAFKR